MQTDIILKQEARLKMQAGVNILADAVKATLGPSGRNVCIRREQPPHTPFVTKDGVTVAATINLTDKFMDMGAQLIKMAAQKTAIDAGDGTTTSTILAQVIIREGLSALSASANPVMIKKGMDKAVTIVVEDLYNQSKPVDDENLIHIATIAANNDPVIGELVANAVKETGRDGVVHIVPSKSTETHFELTKGITIDKGYINAYFQTNQAKGCAELDDVLILFSERKISNLKDIQPILEFTIANKKSLLIIAEDVDGDALTTILANKLNGRGKFCAIMQPGFGNMTLQMFDDIAAMTGGKVVSTHLGHSWAAVDPSWLGRADHAVITQFSTSISGGNGKAEVIEGRIKEVRAAIEGNPNEVEQEKLRNMRLAKLTSGIGVIHVGGQTDVEMKEKLDRIDDAKRATYAAIAEGVVPGGGTAYIRAMQSLEESKDEFTDKDEIIGRNIIATALLAPFYQILENGGMKKEDQDKLVVKVSAEDGFYGYNAKTGVCEDLLESGVIDPAKVSRVALENASSIAGMFLTTEVAISDAQK